MQAQVLPTALLQTRVVSENPSEMTVDVTYSYSGIYGQGVSLLVLPLEDGLSLGRTGHSPTLLLPGQAQTARVVLQARQNALPFMTNQLRVQMQVPGAPNPLATVTYALPKGWRAAGGPLPVVLLAPAATPAAAPPTSGAPADAVLERRLTTDGAVELRYGDGTVVRRTDGGITVVRPNGTKTELALMNSQPATPPAPPAGSGEAQWLQAQDQRLLATLRQLVGGDAAAVDQYAAKLPASLSPYERIDKHTALLSRMLETKP